MKTNPLLLRRREIRKTRVLVAKELGVSPQNVWQWEHDRAMPRVTRIDSLMKAYDVDLDTVKKWLADLSVRVMHLRVEKRTA